MQFTSLEFIAFCLIVYSLYLGLAASFRLQNYMLLVASYVFYGWWDTRFLFLVALSTTVDFWVGLMIENGRLGRAQRFLPAVFLLASAFAFLGISPGALSACVAGNSAQCSLIALPMFGWSLAGTVAFLALVLSLFLLFERLPAPRRRICCLMVSLVTQLGLLAVFKYFNFFIESLYAALQSVGLHSLAPHLNIVLPVGVSFYTFQSLSYTIDIYRRQFKPTERFFDFALFVAYFPQLQAGPIERARQLLPQLSRARRLTFDQISQGLYLIVFGFFKKVAVADGVSPVVDQIFGSGGRISWIDVIAGTALFAVQIYCDFSGYTDIARGISKLLGIDLVINFNQPYFATNPQEFWRRWHISLSTWLRDYLYVSLGGNRGTLGFTCRNLLLTMVIGGLWHGAAWNFVLWGFYQGCALCIYRIWTHYYDTRLTSVSEQRPTWERAARRLGAHAVFLVIIGYGWLLFRAHSLGQIEAFTSLLITDFGDLDYGAGAPRLSALLGMSLLLVLELAQHWQATPVYYRRFPVPVRGLLIAATLAITIMGMSNEPAQFIYFQF
jgi:D-alanyl-lipoteichoic acid acyltransferase DltB (MBOAT superfamily)